MIARSSRSRSQTTEASSKNYVSGSNTNSAIASSKLPNTKSPAPLSSIASISSPQPNDEMISTITSSKQSVTNGPMEVVENMADIEVDIPDNGSSSLSELDGDVSDEEQDAHHLDGAIKPSDLENDSEAETEKLDRTPRKPTIIVAGSVVTDRSPSKLSTVITRETLEGDSGDFGDLDSILDENLPSSPSPDELDPQAPLSLSRTDSKGSLGKRKRPSPDASSFSEMPLDEPSPKRNHALGDDLQIELLNADIEAAQEPLESDAEAPKIEDAASAQDVPDVSGEGEEMATDLAGVDVLVTQKGRFGRRGRRKGRKDVLQDQTRAEASDTPVQDAEELGDEEPEEEEEPMHDEELAKRKVAGEALTVIEKDFASFRERHLREQLNQADHELALLQQSNCTHPDYLARLACVDERREEKVVYENTLLKYNLQALVTKTVAERGQLLSQYHQEVREIRDKAIEKCYTELYALQKDRRRFGTDESSAMLYTNRKMELLQEQTSYNMEVSLLSGIAKHIGFPAAPEMFSLSANVIQEDLEAMELNRTPTSTTIIRSQALRDRTQAGEQFIERTPWLNPQHPAHARATMNNFHTQIAPNNFATPAQQRRFPDQAMVNGSASTVEMLSNPPSSAAAPSHQANPSDIPLDTPIPASRAGRAGKDVERIQTTHNSSTANSTPQANYSRPPPMMDVQQPPEFNQQTSIFQAARRASPVPAPPSRAIHVETLGQAPQRAAITSGGPSGARFGS